MFWRLLVLWVFPAAAAAAGFSWGQVFPPRSSLVVGVFVEGREVGVVEALATEAGVCLSLPDFARLTGTHWDGRVGKLQTPLGEAFFKPAELLRVDDGFYLCPEPARSLLGVEMEFNPVEVTVTLDLPWAVAQPVSWVRPSLVPEVRPPAWGVGTLRGDLWVAREGDTNQWMGSALVTGRALAGQWRLVVDQTTEENPTVRELLWVRSQERTVFLVGRSFLQPSPLLSGLDLVGVQWVWSNEPLPKLGGGWGVALPFATALRSFRGPAPVGSLVRLKLDGFVVASQRWGFQDGMSSWMSPWRRAVWPWWRWRSTTATTSWCHGRYGGRWWPRLLPYFPQGVGSTPWALGWGATWAGSFWESGRSGNRSPLIVCAGAFPNSSRWSFSRKPDGAGSRWP
ncbi:MAG: hypothetical protein RMI39_07660 [Thermoanaerobaculum sp.]|nr:hypothetical protein [Thermoanaerobaculum sp.]